MRLRQIVVAAGLLAVTAGAYAGYWHWMANRLRSGIDEWIAMYESYGYRVVSNWSGVNGFPFRFRAEFHDVEFPHELDNGGIQLLSAKAVMIRMRPWDLRSIYASINAPLKLTYENRPARPSLLIMSPQPLSLDFGLEDDGMPIDIALRGTEISISLDGAGSVFMSGLNLAQTQVEAADGDPSQVVERLSLSIDDLTLTEQSFLPGGKVIDRIVIESDLVGEFLGGAQSEAFAQWRDAGGTLELRRLEISQPGFFIAGDFTLALDQALQPMGAGTIDIEGSGLLLDRLVEIEAIEPGPAALAKAAAKALERTDEKGRKVASLSLTIQDRNVRLGPVVIGRIPKVPWQ